MRITVLPKRNFEYLLEKFEEKGTDISDMFFISILDPEVKEPLCPDALNYKTWWFYDTEETIGNITEVTEEQIKEIYDFIKSNKHKSACYVHCSAGVSRSGAVGTFISDFMQQDYREFRKRHPNILPNGRVLRLLRRLEREDYGNT